MSLVSIPRSVVLRLVVLGIVAAGLASHAAAQVAVCLTPDPTSGAVEGGLPTSGTTPWRTASPSIAFEDSVHALVVFVRFEDDAAEAPEWPIAGEPGAEAVPAWALDLVKEDPAEVTDALGLDDLSLSAYFYWQSKNGPAGPHILTGEVWPRVGGRPVVYAPAGPSTAYRAGRESGYGFLVAELFDALERDPAFDATRFDANRDGELDHLMLVVRRDPGVAVTGGVASLSGVNSPAARTFGRPSPTLAVGDGITVDLGTRGSGAINWVGGERSVATLIHEYGHILFDMGHTAMITPPGAAVRSAVSNDVPFEVPEGVGAYGCIYNRMCGGGARNGRPFESSTYDPALTLSGHELRRMGWARRTVLDSARDTTVVVRPLYGSGDVVLVGLRPGSGADTLSVENRQRTNVFDRFPPWDLDDPFYGLVWRDLPTTGLLATLSHGSPTGPAGAYLYDVAPPSNRFVRAQSRCDGTSPGCVDPYATWARDTLTPEGSATQMTPWTRPNVSGYTLYPAGFEPHWFAVTDVRFTGDADRSMALTFVADVREQPEVVISSDSWMGAETSGHAFRPPVRVVAGATLTVWQQATVTFAGGLVVEPGAAFVCEPGATCVGADQAAGDAESTGN